MSRAAYLSYNRLARSTLVPLAGDAGFSSSAARYAEIRVNHAFGRVASLRHTEALHDLQRAPLITLLLPVSLPISEKRYEFTCAYFTEKSVLTMSGTRIGVSAAPSE